MVNLKWHTLPTLAVLLLVLGLGSAAFGQTQHSVNVSGTLNAGGTFCFAPQQPTQTWGISGSATDLFGNPVSVKWSVWEGSSPTTLNTRLFVLSGPSVGQGFNLGAVYAQDCINNNSNVTVSFTMTQTWF
jgi:hypothetical protein